MVIGGCMIVSGPCEEHEQAILGPWIVTANQRGRLSLSTGKASSFHFQTRQKFFWHMAWKRNY